MQAQKPEKLSNQHLLQHQQPQKAWKENLEKPACSRGLANVFYLTRSIHAQSGCQQAVSLVLERVSIHFIGIIYVFLAEGCLSVDFFLT